MKNLLFIISISCLLIACEKEDSFQLNSNSVKIEFRTDTNLSVIPVNGTMVEQFFHTNLTANGFNGALTDTWTGSLVGTGFVHIFSSDVNDLEGEIYYENVISKRKLFTAEGILFFDEVGVRTGDVIHVISTVSGGTGIYKKATGQLILEGLQTDTDKLFTYSGSITLEN